MGGRGDKGREEPGIFRVTFSASFYWLHRRSEFSGEPKNSGLPESRELVTAAAATTPEGILLLTTLFLSLSLPLVRHCYTEYYNAEYSCAQTEILSAGRIVAHSSRSVASYHAAHCRWFANNVCEITINPATKRATCLGGPLGHFRRPRAFAPKEERNEIQHK